MTTPSRATSVEQAADKAWGSLSSTEQMNYDEDPRHYRWLRLVVEVIDAYLTAEAKA